MQKLLKNIDMKSVSLFIGVAALVMLAPADASAQWFCNVSGGGQGNIFRTMACKITTTLFDIRKIVYIVGGFGLIAFTFAAIFNKISFKHLANIGLSLFLLSAMTPFIEYFTMKDGHRLTFGHRLPMSDGGEADYSGFEHGGGLGYTVESKNVPAVPENTLRTLSTPMETVGLTYLIESRGLDYMIDGGVESAAGEGGGGAGGVLGNLGGAVGGLATVGGEVEDTRTNWQKIKDGVKNVTEEAKKAYGTGATVILGASEVVKAGKSIAGGLGNIKDIGGAIQTVKNTTYDLNKITSVVTGVAGVVNYNYGGVDEEGNRKDGSKVAEALGGLGNASDDAKDMADNAGEMQGIFNGIPGLFGNFGN